MTRPDPNGTQEAVQCKSLPSGTPRVPAKSAGNGFGPIGTPLPPGPASRAGMTGGPAMDGVCKIVQRLFSPIDNCRRMSATKSATPASCGSK
jgi:hypothetical protein